MGARSEFSGVDTVSGLLHTLTRGSIDTSKCTFGLRGKLDVILLVATPAARIIKPSEDNVSQRLLTRDRVQTYGVQHFMALSGDKQDGDYTGIGMDAKSESRPI